MVVIGYGEDGLTYLALTQRLPEFLAGLDKSDDTEPTDCLLFYRPSFGRRGGPGSPMIGEFDAILGTRQAVYLIESKWSDSSSPGDRVVILEPHQVDRHCIFRSIREAWQRRSPIAWEDFRAANPQGFHNRPLASLDRTLGRNMDYLLGRLQQSPIEMRDVLLFFRRSARVCPRVVCDKGGRILKDFQIVTMNFDPLESSSFFAMTT